MSGKMIPWYLRKKRPAKLLLQPARGERVGGGDVGQAAMSKLLMLSYAESLDYQQSV